MKERLHLIIPVYNEEGAIHEVIKDWVEKLKTLKIDFKIYTYNDGSKDNTSEILHQLEKQYHNLVVVDKANSGHGPTILKGYKDNLNVEWLFQIDSDNELKAKDFDKLWNVKDNFDFIIGNRIQRKSPLTRVIITQISRLVIRVFYGNKVLDVNMPYRLMRVAAFKEYIQKIPDDTFAPNLIVTGIANRYNMRITQFDIQHTNRETGEVSIKKWKLFKAALLSFYQTIKFSFS